MKFKFNLSNKISIGYFFIIVIAVTCTVSSIVILQRNRALDVRLSESHLPLYLLLKDFNSLQSNSKRLSNNWVYQPNSEDKKALRIIHGTEYPALEKKMTDLTNTMEDQVTLQAIQSAMSQYKNVLIHQKELTQTLADDSLYSNDAAVDKAIKILDKEIIPASEKLTQSLNVLISSESDEMEAAQQAKQTSYFILTMLLIGMIILFILAALSAYLYSSKNIVRPIVQLKNHILEMGKGQLISIKANQRTDEIGEMSRAMASLVQGINAKSEFALQIGNGKYDTEFSMLSDNDQMGKALLDMRNNLKKSSEEEGRRNWSTQGLAEIGAILRAQNKSAEELYNNIIRFLVKYSKSNQGSMFLLQENSEKHQYLELASCYAWDKRKFLEKKIEPGEGLIGQAMLEKDTIYMTNIPSNYIRITSGLGDATPESLLIVPIKMNDEIHGMIELASFNKFEAYEVELIEKLAETIASTISTVRTNDRTRELLSASQQSEEEMRAQEEEMRQNMEELTATQEEIRRSAVEMESRMQAINESGIASIEFDMKGNIVTANDAFLKIMGYSLAEITGQHHRIFVKPDYARSREYEKFWLDLGEGIAQPGEFERVRKDGLKVFIYGSYSVVRSADGKPKRVLKLASDITEGKLQIVKLREQEEEMKQNLEELSATQEGMEKILAEVKQKEDYMNDLINVSSETIITVDKDYKLISYNSKFEHDMQLMQIKAEKGFSMLQFYTTPEEIAKAKALYDRAFKGENFEDTIEYELGGKTVHLIMNYAPLIDRKGEVYAVALFTKNVTEITEAKRKAELLLADARN